MAKETRTKKLCAFAPGDSVRSEILAGLDFDPASVLLDL